MPRIKLALGERITQSNALRLRAARANETGFERIEQCELLRRRQIGMIGDIIGDARETVECEDRRAISRRDKQRGDGKILIPVSLARAELARAHPFGLCVHCSHPLQRAY